MKVFLKVLTWEIKDALYEGLCIVLCLITGMSATARKRKEEVAQALKKLIQAKAKTPAMKYQQLLDDLRGQSETVSVLNLYFY